MAPLRRIAGGLAAGVPVRGGRRPRYRISIGDPFTQITDCAQFEASRHTLTVAS